MKKYAFAPIIIAFALFLVFLFFPNRWIEHFITDQNVESAATELNPLMFQGEYIQSKMLESKKYFPIYGSSELAHFDPFHPSNYFAANSDGFTPFLYGRGGCQSIIQFMNFAAHANQLKGKKLVFIISPQWFHKNGIDDFHFDPNYSMLQAYDLAFNRGLDPALKKQAIKRLLHFDVVTRDPILTTLFKGEISDSSSAHFKAAVVKPIAYMTKQLLVKKDLYFTLAGHFKRNRQENTQLIKNKSWTSLKTLADQYGKKRSTNNPFNVENGYYKKKIAFRVKQLKGSNTNTSYTNSIEYEDFQMVLDLLKEKNAKPLFVILPVNGKWYDYTGLSEANRQTYYRKIKAQVEQAGFPVADFSNHEYDPYFLKDTMHIGWKGWVYLDEAMDKHWKQ
ncbi:D-alanyl-lipoteichoic acid biosynthesis protein DltD [Bacillus ginsengihumi]|uniref:Protein DltD n=1 Tax=Heyndrickxia ginsengihumi TaxID=363870 RepID=A0A6M0PA27_9BACI|nr:D-alanyl-lipoteichoic acid biosynthesis protein DltD [Heyndrickxia ginsengihumi]NEY20799.1 D-alanyl-lipoteichoic acid biosynthesis protein DltD [Heyndrickxia ginsengihumi]